MASEKQGILYRSCLLTKSSEIYNSLMGLNLDVDSGYTPWGTEPTPEELAEIEKATYVIREIGKPAVIGYTESLERAFGKALYIAERTMIPEGTVIDVSGIAEKRIELRISEDRASTVVQWVPIEAEQPSETIEPNLPA